MGILLLKIILPPIGFIELFCRGITALILWDIRPLKQKDLIDIIWSYPEKNK